MISLSVAKLAPIHRHPAQELPVPNLAFVGSIPGQVAKYDADEEIHTEGDPAKHVFYVVSGVVRAFSLLADGRRQIAAFHFPGDVFGLDTSDVYRLTAEAVCDARLVILPRSQVDAASRTDCSAARELWNWTARELESARAQMLLLGRKNALEKVASFLLQMAGRRRADGVLELPMSRSDIADYLGLTVETVSRGLSHMERIGAISLAASRRIKVCSQTRLNALALQS